MGIIASKSKTLSDLMSEAIRNQMTEKGNKGSIVIDFGGTVLYQGFKKLIDFCYLDDLNVLGQINDSTEMIETIKLANQQNLPGLVKAMESFFQE